MNAVNFIITFIFRYAWLWLLALSLIGVAGLVVGIVVDLRWFIVGLMMIMIVLPMLIGFLYYFYGLRRECYINTIPHSLEFGDEGVTVRLCFTENRSAVLNDIEINSVDDRHVIEREEFFPYNVMLPFQINAKSVIVPFKAPVKGFLWIPSSAFNNEEDLSLALQQLDVMIAANPQSAI